MVIQEISNKNGKMKNWYLIYNNIYLYIHIHTHTYIYIYIYIYTQMSHIHIYIQTTYISTHQQTHT